MDGDTLQIRDVQPLPEQIDYTDNDNVCIIATKAIQTADGLYELINKNCNIINPDITTSGRLEMYLALSGLACEIYMKGILYSENCHGGKKYKGHKLNELFCLLPDEYKNEIN